MARGPSRTSVLLLVLTIALLGARTASADETTAAPTAALPVEDTRRTEARQHFERGLMLAQTGQNWNAALGEFLTSRKLYPTRSATRNAAIALRNLERHVEALDLYTVLLKEFAESMSEEQVAAIGAEMDATRRHIATFEVRCNEPDASVLVDGAEQGKTPLAGPLRLNAGAHVVRLMKAGFEPWELEIKLDGGSREARDVRLQALVRSGTLVVEEASGRRLDVLVDSMVVGQTPWRGSVGEGTHQIVLRGPEHMGTPPSSAEVRLGGTTTLTLRAVPLEAAIQVEPVPSSATVFIDGVSVGNGVWRGRLPAGSHRIEVTAPGHLPSRREVQARPGKPLLVRTVLERDLTSAMWGPRFQQSPYVELTAGAVLAPSLGGGADENCSCNERQRPLGFIAALRGGYTVVPGLGIELTGGFLWLSESMTRQLTIPSEIPDAGPLTTIDYLDATKLSGPLGAVGVSYRMLEKTPVTVRASAGLVRFTSQTSNSGTYSGNAPKASETAIPARVLYPFASRASVPEFDERLLTPFLSGEFRAGYRFSSLVSADIGLALMLFLPPRMARTGATTFSEDATRVTELHADGADGSELTPGNLVLPKEDVAGTFLAVAPTVGVRVGF